MNNNDTGSEDRHLIVKIVSDESFREYEGFDIANTRDETHSKSKLVSYRVATTRSYESFKQDVIDRVGSLSGADVRFWIMRRRINQTIRPSDILGTDIATWRTQANSRSLLLYVEPVTDNTRRRLLFRREPDSTLIFLKYFNVAKQRLYGVGKTYISGRRGTRHLIDDIHKVMGWTDRRTLLLYEEIKPGMIQRLPLDRTLAQNEITNGDIICFQEYLKPEEKQFLSRQFPSFIVDAVHFYAEMRKGSFRNIRALARVFDFSVQPGETFNDAIKRTQERMGLLDKDLTNYQFSCAAGGEEGSSAVDNFNSQMYCGICMEVFVDPVSFLDCMHLSCGACAVEWFSKSDTCPQCRKVVHNVSYNHHTAGVVEAFQNLLPGSSAGGDRTIAELTAMRSKYRPGQVVVIQKPADLDDEYDEEFTDYTGEDMSELDGENEGVQSSVNTDLAIAMVESVQER
ncbi:ubiquitin carboxyl-terminal hydrolase [Ceratobasidium sp. AG-Ba]|nr:ubiquitin carboxyl-terminal hydrolase [Ceratobasidium sp. AG-Ba]